jgi:hypothetical protein
MEAELTFTPHLCWIDLATGYAGDMGPTSDPDAALAKANEHKQRLHWYIAYTPESIPHVSKYQQCSVTLK